MKSQKHIPPKLVILFGIILLIVGMFDLQPTKFGYFSFEWGLGLFYIAFGWIWLKLDRIEDRL